MPSSSSLLFSIKDRYRRAAKAASVRLSSRRISTGNAQAGSLKASALSLHRGRHLLASHSNHPGCRHTPLQLYIVKLGDLSQPSHISNRKLDALQFHSHLAQGSSASYPIHAGMRLQAMASYPSTNRHRNHPGAAHRIAL